jgi:uncharacterized damage-inducible protein DinB
MKNKYFVLGVFAVVIASALSLISFNSRPVDAGDNAIMIADWERAKAYTMDYVNAATDEAIALKPSTEMRTFGQQMLHIAEANFGIAATVSGKTSPYNWGQLEKNPDQYKTKETLGKIVAESYDFAIATIKSMDDAKKKEMIKLFNFDLTREAAMNKAFEHQTHHRGQTTVYLRLKGIKPPDERLF